jgi:hypothetical protein
MFDESMRARFDLAGSLFFLRLVIGNWQLGAAKVELGRAQKGLWKRKKPSDFGRWVFLGL